MSSFTVTNLRSELRFHLGGLDTTDLPDTPDADLLLNRAKWRMEEELNLPANEIKTTFNTVASQAEYTKTFPFDALYSLALEDADAEKLDPLYRMSENDYNAKLGIATTDVGKPTSYFMRGNVLILFPTPDIVYTIRETRKEILTDLGGVSGATTLAMSNALQEIILFRAIEYGHMRFRDYNAAFRVRNYTDGLVKTYVNKDAKEDAKDHYMQVNIILNQYNPN